MNEEKEKLILSIALENLYNTLRRLDGNIIYDGISYSDVYEVAEKYGVEC